MEGGKKWREGGPGSYPDDWHRELSSGIIKVTQLWRRRRCSSLRSARNARPQNTTAIHFNTTRFPCLFVSFPRLQVIDTHCKILNIYYNYYYYFLFSSFFFVFNIYFFLPSGYMLWTSAFIPSYSLFLFLLHFVFKYYVRELLRFDGETCKRTSPVGCLTASFPGPIRGKEETRTETRVRGEVKGSIVVSSKRMSLTQE